MAQKEARREQPEISSIFSHLPAEFGEMGKKRIESVVNAQSELMDNLQEINKHWIGRMQSEANLVSDFASKLTVARSIPDALTAYQEWTSQRLELMAEDGQHLLTDIQKLLETGTHFLGNGWLTSGTTTGTSSRNTGSSDH